LSVKTAAGISAVISTIAYVHQMGDIVAIECLASSGTHWTCV
jgi:hypothetical protein